MYVCGCNFKIVFVNIFIITSVCNNYLIFHGGCNFKIGFFNIFIITSVCNNYLIFDGISLNILLIGKFILFFFSIFIIKRGV